MRNRFYVNPILPAQDGDRARIFYRGVSVLPRHRRERSRPERNRDRLNQGVWDRALGVTPVRRIPAYRPAA